MSVHRGLTWLCERRQGDFTLGWVLRKGWPKFASIGLLNLRVETILRLPEALLPS